MEHNVLMAFGLTAAAGLSTGIGSLLALITKRTGRNFLSGALGFSAGVMIYVSFVEILPKAVESLIPVYGPKQSHWIGVLSFFGGLLLIAVIDRMVPSYENPHEAHTMDEMQKKYRDPGLYRMGIMAALAIAIHNFPEGMATFTSALVDPMLGVSIAVAIALHNIPEGLSVAVPIYFATGSKQKAFWLSFLSGVSEPVGAMIGYWILRPFFSETIYGILFASVAGIMVFISLDELLPTAKEYDHGHTAIYGLASGMFIMALSLLLFM